MTRSVSFAVALLAILACNGQDAPAAPAPQPAPAAPDATATAAAAPACEDALPAVVATIQGEPITAAALEAEGAGQLLEARRALYDARTQVMEGLIVDRLVALELAARQMTEEQLIAAEIQAKLTPPTDAEIEAFYAQNQAQMRGTLEQMKPQIAAYLEQEAGGARMREYLDSLETKYAVVRNLQPMRIEVDPEDSPRMGSADAPVTIVEFSDFQCPYCTMAADTIRQVKAKYGDKVSVVYRHFPLPNHAQAGRAAEAAECANEQGQFWAFHDALFADQKAWTDDDLKGYAKKLDIKMKDFEDCLTSGKHQATVADDLADGRRVGMSGTPGFFVNGLVLSGAQPLPAFVDLIDAELKRLGKL